MWYNIYNKEAVMETSITKTNAKQRVISLILSFLIVISCVVPGAVIVFAGEAIPPVRIQTVSLGNHVSLHTDLQEQYLNGSLESIANYADGTVELSRPAAITLSWNTEIDEAYAAQNNVSSDGCTYTVYFGKADDFSDAKVYTTASTSYQVANLELNTTYYWKVASEIGGEHYESEVAAFTTERLTAIPSGRVGSYAAASCTAVTAVKKSRQKALPK